MPKVLILFFSLYLVSAHSQNETIELSGDIVQYALPTIAAISTIYLKDGTKPGLQFTKSLATAIFATHVLKFGIDKERPNGGSLSFPSGHTSAAFSGAAFIEKRYGLKWGVPCYVLASYVGWTRVDALKHDWVDVSFGAVLGVLSAYTFTKPYKINDAELELSYNANQFCLMVKF